MPPTLKFFVKRRYQLWLLGFVAVLALVVANAAWLLPALGELENNVSELHRSFAVDLKNQVSGFMHRHEAALENAADILNRAHGSREETIFRLMKENPPFESLTLLDTEGLEAAKTHRFLLVSPADLKGRSREKLFEVIRSGQVYRSPVVVSGTAEPILTIALPLKKESGFAAIVAEINLKFLFDVVSGINVGREGAAYIVDQEGYIIAHPNSSLVFGRQNVLSRALVERALYGEEADTRNKDFVYTNELGDRVFAVAVPVSLLNWAVVVENPEREALESLGRIFNVAAMSFILEILLASLLIWNYFNLAKTASLFYNERNQREAILNSLYDGVIEYDAQLRVVLMNPKAEELLGIKLKEIQNAAVTPELAKTNPRARGLVEVMFPVVAPFASGVKDIPGTRAKAMEIHLSESDLKLFVTMTNVLDPAGEVRGFLKILHDVSREHLIGRIKSEFVSVAAHQLRTPLSAIKWTLKLLLEGDAGQLSKDQADFLEKGYEINERMIRLVNDLLNAARIEEGRFGYEFKEMDLEQFLGSIYDSYLPMAQSKYINFRFEKGVKKLPDVYVDPEKLTLAISNLLDNAFKYTPAHGEVVLSFKSAEPYVDISIQDSGLGIPKSEQKRVFSKFFRASNVLRTETSGTGLGLFIVKNIIKRHGGEVRFVSEEGKGASFTFTLPLRKDMVPQKESPTLEEFLEGA